MKTIKVLFLSVLPVLAMLLMTGCDKIDGVEIEGSGTFYGSVKCDPVSTSEGETVTLSVGPYLLSTGESIIGISNKTEINGKNVVKSISYYIDGEFVADSKDEDSRYKIMFKVTDLSKGEHQVTAVCNSRYKKYIISSIITPGTLTIE